MASCWLARRGRTVRTLHRGRVVGYVRNWGCCGSVVLREGFGLAGVFVFGVARRVARIRSCRFWESLFSESLFFESLFWESERLDGAELGVDRCCDIGMQVTTWLSFGLREHGRVDFVVLIDDEDLV